MLLCYYVIPGLGHAIRMSVEQPISVMVSHTVPISSHAGLVGVTSCPPVVAVYPYVNMAAHKSGRIRPDTGPADAPASII